MGHQAPLAPLNTYVETRVDLEPIGQGPVVQIQLPSSTTFSRAPRPHRRVVPSSAICENDETYSKTCLASASSIYFSKSRRYPRGFLWRVLDNSKVLELRTVDQSKHDRESREATVVLQLVFPTAIRKGCVALADDGQDVLSVFAVSKSNELFYLTLPTQFFCDVAASEEELGKWCNTSTPSTMCNIVRLVAASPQELVATLDDGGIMKLSRNKGQAPDGSIWQCVTCNSAKWGSSLRGLIRWQGNNSVRYDGAVLDPSTAIAAEFSPSQTHLITVCVNHTMKIWNLSQGRVVFSMDLLGQEREPQDVPRVLLDAGNPEILRIFEAEGAFEGDEYYAVTYSPHEEGQFKIWAIRDPDHGSLGVRFLYPDDVLRPPDPESSLESKAVWKLADFKVGQGSHDRGLELWVLMRSSRRYKTFIVEFGLTDFKPAWSKAWMSIVSETLDQQAPPQVLPTDLRDAPELWLEYLLFPGRYSRAILECALSMYSSARRVKDAIDAEASLKDRLFSTVTTQVGRQQVKPQDTNDTHFEQYREALQQEWQLLYQEIQDLERLTWQALTLAFDYHANIPWLIFTGGCAAVRDCSRLESITHNPPAVLHTSMDLLEAPSIEDDSQTQPKRAHELAVLVQGAASFTAAIGPSFSQTCHVWLSNELWQEPLYSVSKRIEDYYDRCGFAEEITDPAITGLREALIPIGDIEGLTTDHLLAAIEEPPRIVETQMSNLIFTTFGRKLLVRGAQEMINLHARILFDLLVLIVFVEVEVDKDILPKSRLDTPRVFMGLIEQLKRYEVMKWLAKSVWSQPAGSLKQLSEEAESSASLSILETVFAAGVHPQSLKSQSQSASLTDSIQDLLVYTTGGNNDNVIVHVQCNLLKQDEIDLASDFLSFQPSTAWAVYIKGRYHLARSETTEAAMCFQSAAYKMASKSPMDYHQASSGFLSTTEAAHFGQGLPFYYQHIHHLFHSASNPSYAAHFARLALQFTPQSPSLEPPTGLLTSLFTSSLQTSDFQSAFTALTRLPHAEQQTHLATFINTLLTSHKGPRHLLDLPWPPHLHPSIDAYLAKDKSSQPPPSSRPALPPDHQCKILAAWRLQRGDFRGAAAALYAQLQHATQNGKRGSSAGRFKQLNSSGDGGGGNNNDRRVDEGYLTVINLLACIGDGKRNDKEGEREAWLLSAAAAAADGGGDGRGG
ncbi:MAG: hypothetical protein L6R39_005041, partial [Caloplaca ligustica]